MSFSNLVRWALVSSSMAVLAACGGGGGGGSGSTPLPTYTIGGSVSGLATGASVVLQNNGGNNLTVSANGSFSFSTAINSGTNYAVSVLTNPSSPLQVCTVTGGGSGVASANVTNVAVTCVTSSFGISGTVSGLSGSVVIQNNGGGNQTISANGPISFPAQLSGTAYAITVLTNPANQNCTVSNGAGTITNAAVTNVAINCATIVRTVGGTVSGLAGSGLVLNLNAGNQSLPVTANGTFVFLNPVAAGTAYTVTVTTQPSTPTQNCVVTNGSGTVSAAANVTNVTVTCTTRTFTVGGTVSGLSGTGLVLQNNAGNNVAISANGAFTFSTAVNSGSAYAVTVLTQPSLPPQTCTVGSGSGTVTTANITNVTVTCVTSGFTVGGTVTGLAASGTVVLQNNGGNNLTVSANGTFTFAGLVSNGGAYAVTRLTNPTVPAGTPLGQTCTVTNGSGTIASANVTNVAVNCVNNDTTAPTVTAKTPLPTAMGTSVAAAANIVTATFSEAMDTSTITSSTFTVKSGNALTGQTTVTGTLAFTTFSGNTKVTFTPSAVLSYDTDYTVTATTGVKDGAGNALASAVSWSFNTGKRIITGGSHACARFTDGRVKCWGSNSFGQLGIGNNVNHGDGTGLMGNGTATGGVGDGLLPVFLGTGRTAVALAAGDDHTCAILDDGSVRCWGHNAMGELGMGFTTTSLGDSANDMTLNAVSVNLGAGRTALQISVGNEVSCARLDDGTVKCWGDNTHGALGQELDNFTLPNSNVALPVSLGTGLKAIEIAVGGTRGCAILDNNALKCWGDNRWGQAGSGQSSGVVPPNQPNINDIGDGPNEMGDSLVAVNLGTFTPLHVAVADGHTCVLTTAGAVRCFGNNTWGQSGSNLGNGAPSGFNDCDPLKNNCIGDASTEMGNNLPQPIAVSGAVEVTVGYRESCARSAAGAIKCWGNNAFGQIGLGTNVNPADDIGDQAGEIAALVAASMKGTPAELSSGGFYECVTLGTGTSQCWGRNEAGQLGRGDTNDAGASPFDMGANLIDLNLGN